MQVGGWNFENERIARGFDEHVRGHLPWYDLATDAVALAAKHYITEGGVVFDIGCASGNIGRALEPVLTARKAHLVAVDRSEEMAARYDGPGRVVVEDLADMEFDGFDVAVCMLTLMFLSPRQQSNVLARLMGAVNPGGAVIIVERFDGFGGYVQTIMQRMTMAAKVRAGTPPGEVIEKELSLVGVQRPLNKNILFAYADKPAEFFRFGEFAGYILPK